MASAATLDGTEHLAFVRGDVAGVDGVLVRVHSECVTGDVFGSHRCDCGPQLRAALRRIANEDRGVIVYLRGHEGRSIDAGSDLADGAGREPRPDNREYGIGAQILVDLGVTSMRLMTNNTPSTAVSPGTGCPSSSASRSRSRPTRYNEAYLRAKRDQLGHLLEVDPWPTT